MGRGVAGPGRGLAACRIARVPLSFQNGKERATYAELGENA